MYWVTKLQIRALVFHRPRGLKNMREDKGKGGWGRGLPIAVWHHRGRSIEAHTS